MKILKINISGYKLLENNFEIDFLNKARVNSSDKDDEVIELDEGLYIPTTIVFTGKNASGKSSVLSMIEFVNELLLSGRIKYDKLDFRSKTIKLTVFFYLLETVYKYESNISIPEATLLNETSYCKFSNEKLYSKKYSKSYSKRILDLDFDEDNTYTSNVSDTSILYKLTNKRTLVINTNNWIHNYRIESIFDIFNLVEVSTELMLKITNLFDEGIKKFEYDLDKKLFVLDLNGIGAKTYSEKEVDMLLSDGTKKGLIMFGLTIAILKMGGTLIIDEIENSFHKNLVENIIMIFNDKRINVMNANLIFSTHYVEILDIFRRRDNIFVMRKNDHITACNLYKDFKDRIDLSKSNQFNNNTFQTLINYDRLMELKKELINEISNTVRG
ncbi:AAA15 family ATPase/GTPase [Acholeplasma morum]|uniref:AAA family ATPase n=1 Tax=Paracholeplasma morum TaxID=264637 RepID=UPI00195E631E|nr:AAA family ATPase [Paracholeplasma morum]MBM7453048.1 AAA15 family ATPase/GTPase [Paracholeplasma morum]